MGGKWKANLTGSVQCPKKHTLGPNGDPMEQIQRQQVGESSRDSGEKMSREEKKALKKEEKKAAKAEKASQKAKSENED